MKNNIRKQKKKFKWLFFPPKESKLKKNSYSFKYKKDLLIFLNKNFYDSIHGTVRIDCRTFNSSMTYREYYVWFNKYELFYKNLPLKIVLKQEDFRGRKYVSKPSRISKEDVKYFAFSNKKISLMCNIEKEDGTILENDAKRLVSIFYKSGFKDFEPDEDDKNYIDYYLKNGIDFFHWSDRCSRLRTKTVIEYLKLKFENI